MSNIITPQIRFAGFTDAWEQRKLGDLIEENLKPVPKPDGEYTRLGIRSHAKGTFHEVVAQGEGLNVDTMYVVEANNLIVNITFAWEEAWAITTEKDAEKLVSHRFPQYCFNQDQCPMFYQYRFRNGQMKYNLELASPGGAGRNRVLNKTEFMKIPVTIPKSYEEQKEIGIFFSRLDDIITLHQRKCDTLHKFKKSMLQKMFPQNSESVPEIRFAGFTDAWEQRKLSEGVSEIGDGLHGTPTYCDDGNVYFINGNNLVNGRIVISEDTKKVDEEQQSIADKSLDNNTILMSINGTIGNLAYYSGEKLMLGKSAAYIKVSEFNKKFVYIYLQTPSIQTYFMDSLTGTTIKNLGLKAIREMTMPIPQDIEEQKQIGEFFDNLDTLITLHQRKLETLQKMKKSLLQKMFV